MALRYVRLSSDTASTAFSLSAGSPCARAGGPRVGVAGHVDVKRRGSETWILRYDVHEIDAEGRAVVFWDSDLWKLAPGWYVLEVWMGCNLCAEVLARIGDECGVTAAASVQKDCASPCDDCASGPAPASEVPAYTPTYLSTISLKGC